MLIHIGILPGVTLGVFSSLIRTHVVVIADTTIAHSVPAHRSAPDFREVNDDTCHETSMELPA